MPWPRSGSITVRVLAIGERLVFQRLDNRAIRGTDDAVRAEELFHAVRRPAGHTGDGEQRCKERLGHAEHLVDKARVQVDVGADGLVMPWSRMTWGARRSMRSMSANSSPKFFLAASERA